MQLRLNEWDAGLDVDQRAQAAPRSPPLPDGESWRQAVHRVGGFLTELRTNATENGYCSSGTWRRAGPLTTS